MGFLPINRLASLCHYIMYAVKYEFTSKTGRFESYAAPISCYVQ